MLLVAGTFIIAQGAGPTSNPSSQPTGRRSKLVQPWSHLTTLSAEQKSNILQIHSKALDEINKIKDKEEADITALLTDAQKQELKTILDQEKLAAKLKAASRPAGK